MGVGISRGSAIFGNVGAPNHMAYTLIEDAVKVAARFIQLAGGGEILLSADIATHATELMRKLRVEEMQPISLKGKDRSVAYFRPVKNDGLDDVPAARSLGTYVPKALKGSDHRIAP